jgi:hypothetical protein
MVLPRTFQGLALKSSSVQRSCRVSPLSVFRSKVSLHLLPDRDSSWFVVAVSVVPLAVRQIAQGCGVTGLELATEPPGGHVLLMDPKVPTYVACAGARDRGPFERCCS